MFNEKILQKNYPFKSLVIGIFFSSSIGAFANVSEPVKSNIENTEVVNQLITNLEDEVEVNGEGLYTIDKNAIKNEIINMDDNLLEILCNKGGFNSTDEVVDAFIAGIESVNEQIETREIVFIDDENLISSEDCDYYLQGGVPNGLTSAYCWHLATNVSYYNSLSSRGIVAKITWALAYSMRTQ